MQVSEGVKIHNNDRYIVPFIIQLLTKEINHLTLI